MAGLARRAHSWRFVSQRLLSALLASLGPQTRAGLEAIAQVRAASLEELDMRAAVERRRQELGATRVAVSVGRLVPGKRVDRAIEHVARGTTGVHELVVVGDGPERPGSSRWPSVATWPRPLRGDGAQRHDALASIGATECVIHASRSEGLSTVVREAEGLGVPVVAIGEE